MPTPNQKLESSIQPSISIGKMFYLVVKVMPLTAEDGRRCLAPLPANIESDAHKAFLFAKVIREDMSSVFLLPSSSQGVVVGKLYPLELLKTVPGLADFMAGYFVKESIDLNKKFDDFPGWFPIVGENAEVPVDLPPLPSASSVAGEPMIALLPIVLLGDVKAMHDLLRNQLKGRSCWQLFTTEKDRKETGRLLEAMFEGEIKVDAIGLIDSNPLSADWLEMADNIDNLIKNNDVEYAASFPLEGTEIARKTLETPMYAGNGYTYLPFLTLDAFFETFQSELPFSDSLDVLYLNYLLSFRSLSHSVSSAMPLHFIRGTPALFTGTAEERRADLLKAINEPNDDFFVEHSSYLPQREGPEPSSLRVYMASILTDTKEIICFIIIALDEKGKALWQKQLYPLLPGSEKACMDFISLLEHRFKVEALYSEIEGIEDFIRYMQEAASESENELA